jgi:hypothetical protein
MHGAVAQLGEHLLCKQGVTGSIPVSSTIPTAQRKETDSQRKQTEADCGQTKPQVLLGLLFRSLTIWNDPSIEVEYGFDKRRTVFF